MQRKFRALAIIHTYNDADIISHVLNHLLKNKINIYLINDGSTDGTHEIIENKFKDKLYKYENIPYSPHKEWNLYKQLVKIEDIAEKEDFDWFLINDDDEMRTGPLPLISLKSWIRIVDILGYNCINYTVLNFAFKKGQKKYNPESPIQNQLKYYYFGLRPGFKVQYKTWKKQPVRVDLSGNGGHNIQFPGRKPFILNFILKHYPYRSEEQMIAKLSKDRADIISKDDQERNFNTNYRNKDQDINSYKFIKYTFLTPLILLTNKLLKRGYFKE